MFVHTLRIELLALWMSMQGLALEMLNSHRHSGHQLFIYNQMVHGVQKSKKKIT